MGIDAKGRNFSAPRLTPGRKHELMTYGSPAMIKDQDRQIAVMNDRARRYGYAVNSSNLAKYGGTTARALGTSEGYNQPPTTVRNYSSSGSQQKMTPATKAVLIIFLIFFFMPFIIPILAVIFEILEKL